MSVAFLDMLSSIGTVKNGSEYWYLYHLQIRFSFHVDDRIIRSEQFGAKSRKTSPKILCNLTLPQYLSLKIMMSIGSFTETVAASRDISQNTKVLYM